MNRSFRHRAGALAGVLLAGTVLLAWASPASAAPTTGSEARFGPHVASCPTNGALENEGPQTIGTVTASVIQCATAADGSTSSAQVQGTYSGGDFMLQCTRTGNTYILNQQVEGGDNDQVVSQTPISRTIVLNGVPISVFCGPAAAPYPLAVDVGAASGGGPDLATQASTSTGSSGSGATWLFVAGGAAVLLVIGQLVIGRRVGRSNSATD